MTYLFNHSFKNGMGPFITRSVAGHDTPSSDDCARIVDGVLELSVLDNPLRTGHVFVPPEVFNFTHGEIQFRLRFPAPRGAHSSGWLQATQPYLTPEHHEVDVAEHFGHEENVYHSIWTGPQPPIQIYKKSARLTPAKWNVYSVDCRRGGYKFKINGVEVGRSLTKNGGYGSSVPKMIILSILVDEWEKLILDRLRLDEYYLQADWVRVLP